MKSFKYLIALCILLGLPLAANAQIAQSSTGIQTIHAPASPAVTVVKSTAGILTFLICGNINATPVYVQLFDATSVTLGTTSATYTLMCPGNTAGAGYVLSIPWPLSFTSAIRVAVTGGIAANDNTSITASTVTLTGGYQ